MKNKIKKNKYDYIKQNVSSGDWSTIVAVNEAYRAAKRLRKKRRIPELEEWIIHSPVKAVDYARIILNSRWPEAEENIFNYGTPKCVFLYVSQLIKERCEKAEKIIITSPEYSYRYAKEILNKRWPEAEKNMLLAERQNIIEASNFFMLYSFKYGRDIVKDRWEDLEKIICDSPDALKYYAENIMYDVLVEELHNRMICFAISSDQNESRAAKEYLEFAKQTRIDLAKKLKRFNKNLSIEEIIKICENG